MVGDQASPESAEKRCTFEAVSNLLSGSLLLIMTGMITIFFVYIVELKTIFHYTQTQAEIHEAAHMIGKLFILPFAVTYDRVGFYGTSVMGVLVCGGGLLVLAFSAQSPQTFSTVSPAIYFIAQFSIANGRAYLYFLIMLIAMRTFSKRDTGKAISFLSTTPVVGQIICTWVYTRWFVDVSKTSTYFFLSLVLILVTTSTYVLVYAVCQTCGRRKTEADANKFTLLQKDSDETVFSNDNAKNFNETPAVPESPTHPHGYGSINTDQHLQENMSFKEVWLSCKLHLFLWSGTIIGSTNYVIYINESLYLQSMGKDEYKATVVTSMLAALIISRLISGFLYDLCNTDYHKVFLLLVSSLTNILSYVVILIWMDSTPGIFVSGILTAVTLGVSFPCCVSFSKQIFGLGKAAAVQSVLMSCVGIFTCIFSVMTGILYDSVTQNSSKEQDHICHGVVCYRRGYTILMAISLLAPILLLALCWTYARKK